MTVTATSTGPDPVGAVQAAQGRVGEPYRYGGDANTGPTDCSGLVQWSYAKIGVSLPRTADAQHAATTEVGPPLLPGDLLFFHDDNHVAMVVGPGLMIEDPHTGAFVRVVPTREDYQAHTRVIPGGLGAAVAPIATGAALAGANVDPGKASAWLASPHGVWRIIEGIIGAGAILAGLIMLSKTLRGVVASTAKKGALLALA